MRRNWIAIAMLACACLVIGVAAAAAEDAPPVSEEAAPANEEAAPAAPDAEDPSLSGEDAATAAEKPSLSEGAAPNSLLDESCNSGHACVWTEYNFQGAKGESLCTGGKHEFAGYKQSGKNRCANKAVWFRAFGTAHYCVNPGGQENYFFYLINELWVGAEGSHC